MEPTTLILAALTFGAQAVAGEAIADAYQKLKGFIKRKFAGDTEAEATLEKFEKQPEAEASEAEMKAALMKHEANKDEEIVGAAQQVITHVNPQQVAQSKYNTQITGGVKGFVQGDNAQVTMTFNDKD
jgi:cytochrome c551/c552